jgi:anti-sigma-K factor RskA
MDHRTIKELLAMSAVARLDPDEEKALSDHLRQGCDECEAERLGFQEIAAVLALAGLDSDGGDPTSEERIWNRLQARLDASRSHRESRTAAQRPAGTDRGATAMRRSARVVIGSWTTGIAVAAGLVIAIYAGAITHKRTSEHEQLAALTKRLLDLRADLASSDDRAASLERKLAERTGLERVLMAADLQLVRLLPDGRSPGPSAIVVVSQSSNTALIRVAGLPPTPAGKTYELWWITRESGPVAAGLFGVKAQGEVIERAELPPAGQRVTQCAVTLEPAGGVGKPTGPMYLRSKAGFE